MTKTGYSRPAKTTATAVGERNRTQWSRVLRSKLYSVLPPLEFMAAEEAVRNRARAKHTVCSPSWVTTRIRIDQMATIEVLQARHLKTTGKEISKSEVLAALMAAGLETTIKCGVFSA